MRVLIVNTSERTGGAAIAANRLMEALKNNGVKVTMLVRDKQTPQITVSATGAKWLMAIRFLWERLVIWAATGFNKKDIWQVDIANVGTDITKTDEFKKADVIHLHWVNQGFLSMKGLKKILNSGKRGLSSPSTTCGTSPASVIMRANATVSKASATTVRFLRKRCLVWISPRKCSRKKILFTTIQNSLSWDAASG